MRRWVALGIVVIVLLAGLCLLGQTAIDPAEFAGDWYGAEDGRLYQFRDGIITCPQDSQSAQGSFSGAYSFCADRVLLFTIDPGGQSRLRELYPAGEPKGEFLCESADGVGRIHFSRSNIAEEAETSDTN